MVAAEKTIQDAEMNGFRGWLAFFVWWSLLKVSSLIIIIILSFFNDTLHYKFVDKYAPHHFLLIKLMFAIFHSVVIYLLIRRKPSAVMVTKIFLMLAAIYALAWCIFYMATFFGGEPVAVRKCLITLLTFITWTAWYIYFTKSKRVRNTFY